MISVSYGFQKSNGILTTIKVINNYQTYLNLLLTYNKLFRINSSFYQFLCLLLFLESHIFPLDSFFILLDYILEYFFQMSVNDRLFDSSSVQMFLFCIPSGAQLAQSVNMFQFQCHFFQNFKDIFSSSSLFYYYFF